MYSSFPSRASSPSFQLNALPSERFCPCPFNRCNVVLHDRYRILRLLGQRGFGRTFLAIDEWQLSRRCVVKQLLPGYSIDRQTVLTLFQQEAQPLAALGNHLQIPKLLDTFEQNGEHFMVQEWIDGWTLEKEAAGVPFDEIEVRNVLLTLLPVLQSLHDRQIIHCDLKPANIIRRKSDRQLVLVDFGSAKQLNNSTPLLAGAMIGSVEYAAPEQIEGQTVFASDLYSLGVTCLHLLTQVPPFDLYDIIENDWKWQAYLPQPISSELKAILCKLLQPAIRRRYQSATEVLIDLHAAFVRGSDQPIKAAIINTSTRKICSAKTTPFPDTSPLTKAVQATSSVSGATIYLPQTQGWYYVPVRVETSAKSNAAFSLSPRMAAAATPPVQTLLYADELTTLKELPLVWRVLLMSTVAAVGSVAMACLLLCLSIITFALTTPQPSSATLFKNNQPLKNNQSIFKPF